MPFRKVPQQVAMVVKRQAFQRPRRVPALTAPTFPAGTERLSCSSVITEGRVKWQENWVRSLLRRGRPRGSK